ncbi:hypothetical protein [Streptomyces sp. NBC_01304]|uniref:hypothetical protein n=1 Tax=Streptomyces sp. NBC_01304 TaxID=2903818 RepID=UPI002E14B0CE|nr:hypothetical protein OG430_24405 [Streptomyces sp. NBC_01304]
MVLLVLACLLAPLGALSTWAKYDIGDTDAYVQNMAPLASNAAVQDAVADAVTKEVMKAVDLGPLTGTVETFINDAVKSFTGTKAFQTAWNAAVRAAHDAVQRALDDGSTDTVTIDLAPITKQLKQQLVDEGAPFAKNIPVQHTEITVMTGNDLGSLRKGFHMLQIAGIWLPVASVLCALAGIALAVRRRRAITATGLGVALAAVLLGIALLISRHLTLSDLPPDISRDAAAAVYDALTSALRLAVWVMLGVGLAVALGAFLAGRFSGRSNSSGERV